MDAARGAVVVGAVDAARPAVVRRGTDAATRRHLSRAGSAGTGPVGRSGDHPHAGGSPNPASRIRATCSPADSALRDPVLLDN